MKVNFLVKYSNLVQQETFLKTLLKRGVKEGLRYQFSISILLTGLRTKKFIILKFSLFDIQYWIWVHTTHIYIYIYIYNMILTTEGFFEVAIEGCPE